jgi:tellurite resistance protein TerC
MHWTGFHLFIGLLLLLDLITSRSQRPLTLREAVMRSLFWIAVGLGVNVWVYLEMGSHLAMDFFSAYLLEKSLSVDNLFVFLIIFRYFKVPQPSQQRVLLFGVLGALIMRGALIFAGISLVQRYHWILYLFAIILIVSGIKMGMSDDEADVDPDQNPVVRWTRRHFPLHPEYVGKQFFVRLDGKLLITPLFIVLVAIETTDLVFALDSIPAVFAISQDSFIVYSSNIMAILGLRALYFALAGMMGMFHYLQQALSVVLVFIGVEMLTHKYFPISTPVELAVIAGILSLAVIASLVFPRAKADD